MRVAQTQFQMKTAIRALVIASAFAAGAFPQGIIDTARVPFVVNVAAAVTAQPPSGATGVAQASRNVAANKADTLAILLRDLGGTSVSHRPQGQANASATVRYSRGGVLLQLPPESYKNAEISLFSVNGRQILRGKASASNAGEINISRPNMAAGVYLLSVRGVNGSSFATRMTHQGGNLGISAAFGSEAFLSKTSANYGTWTITVSAPGYVDSTYPFSPVKGPNPTQNITLRQTGPGPNTQIGCTRAGLNTAVDTYIAALKASDHTLMPLSAAAKYSEYDNASIQNYRTGSVTPTVSNFGEGLWKKPRTVDFHRSLIDTAACATFTEVIINKDSKDANDPPYITGVRLNVSGGQISEVHVLVTVPGDWLFNAANYYNYSSKEDWGELPANQRLTRERLRDDAEAYFKYFRDTTDKTVNVPWGIPCARLEGGAYTNPMNSPTATCKVGVPSLGMSIPTIWWLADVDYGMAVLFVYFGGADSHLFRILPTGYRYIHTLTAMKQSDYVAP
jgi:hypothetical protein